MSERVEESADALGMRSGMAGSEQAISGMGKILTMDIGGTKIGSAITQLPDLHIGTYSEMPTNAEEGGEAVAQRVLQMVRQQLQSHPDVVGVAIASAGVIDPNTGAVLSATNTMPGWSGTPLGDLVAQAAAVPVAVINDVHAHGLGEAVCGAGRGYRSVLAIAVGTGIGGALVVGGDVVLGEHFLAGHVGHIHHHEARHMRCSCGRYGHIEGICSGHGITNWFNAEFCADGEVVANGKELYDRANAGDPAAKRCFTRSAFALGEAVGSLVNSVDPAIVVLSGSMTKSGDTWWRALRDGYGGCVMDPVAKVALVHGVCGSRAPLLGAAIAFSRRYMRRKI
ncbi:ROK family protein [Trueperella sp. LYQ141]|uniref:ROK family protein n=1 Tax=Trueperella sp. LYQ141 TaxID=3391058 RepID=UPI003983358B